MLRRVYTLRYKGNEGGGMVLRLLVFTQGRYGERILDNIRFRAPKHWIITHELLPGDLPPMIDEPNDFISSLAADRDPDLVLFMGESPSAFSLLPSIMKRVSAEILIAPVDDYSWLPLGLERQIGSELEERGVRSVFPRTFCTLAPEGEKYIDEFTRVFGSPQLIVEADGDEVKSVDVLRGAPCGSTWQMADKLAGTKVNEAAAKAGTLVQIYPCFASRKVERFLGDSPIHMAGHIAGKALEKALRIGKEGYSRSGA
jgi:hypothetical protein